MPVIVRCWVCLYWIRFGSAVQPDAVHGMFAYASWARLAITGVDTKAEVPHIDTVSEFACKGCACQQMIGDAPLYDAPHKRFRIYVIAVLIVAQKQSSTIPSAQIIRLRFNVYDYVNHVRTRSPPFESKVI